MSVEENEQVVAYALAKRPNVKLVETNLAFGNEGFVSYRGKTFPPSLKLTRRYYPHTYNVDGFFVAKFHKFGPTPANAVLVDRTSSGPGKGKNQGHAAADEAAELVDRAPIVDEDAEDAADDDFGGFDDDEDEQFIQRAKRNAMRRRGLDPKALAKGKKDGAKAKPKEAEEEAEAEAEPTKEEEKVKPKKAAKEAKEAKPKKEDAKVKKPKKDSKAAEPKEDAKAEAKEDTKAKPKKDSKAKSKKQSAAK